MDYYDRPTERYASPPRRRKSISEKAKDAVEGLVPGHYAESRRPHHGRDQHHERGRSHRYDYDSYDSDSDSYPDGYGADEERRRRRRRQQRCGPSRPHHDEREPRRTRERSRTSESGLNWKQATGVAVSAALIEGWHSRHTADRNARVATAAAGAAAIDLAIGHEGDGKNKRHALESTLGGLMIDRVVNGSTTTSSTSSGKR